MEQIERAVWDTAKINDLPDGDFAYIEPGGSRDEQGKTVPRSLRHLPYKDHGKVDLDHLRAALSRVSQTDLPAATQARVRSRLEAAAAKHGVGEHEKVASADGALVEKYITHESGKWQVRSEAGKVLGEHDSKGDAVRQLAAVEANKEPKAKQGGGSVRWPVMPRPGFRGSSLTDAGEKAPNQKGIDEEYEKFLDQVHSAVKAAAGPGSEVQTLIFGKDKYPKAADAKAWAGDHGFKSGDVDETEESFRLRQRDPGKYARMRTISLTEGVQAVVGFPKRSLEAVKAAFLAQVGSSAKAADLDGATFEPVGAFGSGTVYAVKCAGRTSYFAEAGGSAAPVPMYEVIKRVNAVLAKSRFVPIVKAEEQRYTLSVVYPCSAKGKPEPDFHGDVMSSDEIRKSAWGFMEKGTSRIGLMHRPGTAGSGRVVESYTWPEDAPEWKIKDAGGADQSVSPNDWLMGIVWTPEAWQEIKAGNITGLSLQGAARKEALA